MQRNNIIFITVITILLIAMVVLTIKGNREQQKNSKEDLQNIENRIEQLTINANTLVMQIDSLNHIIAKDSNEIINIKNNYITYVQTILDSSIITNDSVDCIITNGIIRKREEIHNIQR